MDSQCCAAQIHGKVFWSIRGSRRADESWHEMAMGPCRLSHSLQLPSGDPSPAAHGRAVHGQQAPGACGSQVTSSALQHNSPGICSTLLSSCRPQPLFPWTVMPDRVLICKKRSPLLYARCTEYCRQTDDYLGRLRALQSAAAHVVMFIEMLQLSAMPACRAWRRQ